MGFFAGLLRSKIFWIIVAVGLAVLIFWGNVIHPWLAARALDLSGAQAEIAAVQRETVQAKKETEQAQLAITNMTKEISRQKAIADAARLEAVKHAAAESRWKAEASRLSGIVTNLEAARKALPEVKTRQQEMAELKRLGY